MNKNHQMVLLEKKINQMKEEINKRRETTASSTSTIQSSRNHRTHRNHMPNNSLPPTLGQYNFNNPQNLNQSYIPQPSPFQASAQMMLNPNAQSAILQNPIPMNPSLINPNPNMNSIEKYLEKQLKEDEEDYGVDFKKNQKLMETIEKQSKLLENLASTINQEKEDKFSDERHFLEKRLKKLEKYNKNPSEYFKNQNPSNSSSNGFNNNNNNQRNFPSNNPFGNFGGFPGMGPPGWMGNFPGMMTGMPPIMPGFPGLPGMNGLPPGMPGMGMMHPFMGNGFGPNSNAMTGLMSRHPELLKKLGILKEEDDKRIFLLIIIKINFSSNFR